MKAARILYMGVLAVSCLTIGPIAAHAQTGTIAGTVVEDGTATPLFGATPNEVRVGVYTSLGTAVNIVATDAAGHYSVPSLAPGSYYVRVLSAPGHVPEIHNDIPCIALDCTFTSGNAVTVAASATTTIDFSLAKEGIITGTVRRAADNSPVGSVTVTIYNLSTSYVTEATSASDGTYVAKGLATGSYFARIVLPANGSPDFITELYGGVQCPNRAPASDCRIAASSTIAVTAGSFTNGIDFSLDKGATITGKVTIDGTTTAIGGVTVNVYAGDLVMGTAMADLSGNYTVRGLPAGRYRVRTSVDVKVQAQQNYVDEWQNGVCVGCSGAIATLELTAGQDLTGVNFALATGGSISGTITCTGPAPQDGHHRPEIAVFTAAGQLLKSVYDDLLQCVAGTPATYTVPGLPTGTYFLWVRDTPNSGGGFTGGGLDIDQLYGGLPCNTADCDVRKGVPVTVTAGATTSGIDFLSQRGVSFSVVGFPDFTRVTDLKIYDARGVEVVNAIGLGPSPLVQSALFVAGIPPGTYFLTGNGRPAGASDCLGCPPTAGVPVIVGPNGTNGAPTFTVPSRRVSGTITNVAGGGPLSTVSVELVTPSGMVVGTALSDLFGRYTVSKIAAGTYFARTVNDRGFVDEIYSDAGCGTCDPRTGTPVVVGASDIAGIDFALAAGGTVAGLVADTTGVVLGNVPVSLFSGTTTFAGVKKSSASGRYRVTLPAATYRAVAEASTNKGSEIYSEMPCTSAGCDPATGTAIAVTAGAITSNIDFTSASCSTMSISPPLFATGVVGSAYRQVVGATGGTGPFVFDVTDGTLPLGLTLNASTGVLSGTPTVSGRATFRVSAVAANGCATDRSYVLDVQACRFTLSASSATVPPAGGTVTVTIANACGSEAVVEASDWISVQSAIVTPGSVTLIVSANPTTAPRIATVAIGRRAFEVRQAGTGGSQAPFGMLDLPAPGAHVSGAVAVGGWALDDLEVTRVRIYRDAVGAEPAGLVLLGDAVFIPGARPDVQQAAPNVPRSDRAGFGFMILTNTLPNSTPVFRISAVAEDAEGHSTLLGSSIIVVENASSQLPFGTIDTPTQGGTIAGSSYINFGWALTPRPAMISTDGSTIQVIIDGVPIGTADYNHFRPDVSNTFPGLANSSGPVGFRIFDTTALAEGLHTISWSVTDSRPATAGIGSRYFVVANSADTPSSGGGSVTATETTAHISHDMSNVASEVAMPLGAAPAPDLGRRAESLALDATVESKDGSTRTRRLTLRPMERLEVPLDSLLDANDQTCAATWAGYLVKDKVLMDLPVGASLDPAGTFYWQTGPGFAGRFPLLFVRTDCRGEKQQAPVTVTIPLR
jgi:hypothetical protein